MRLGLKRRCLQCRTQVSRMTQERLIKKLTKLQRSADRFCQRRGIVPKTNSSDYEWYMEKKEALILEHHGLFPADHPVSIWAKVISLRNDAVDSITEKNRTQFQIRRIEEVGKDVPSALYDKLEKETRRVEEFKDRARQIEHEIAETKLRWANEFDFTAVES